MQSHDNMLAAVDVDYRDDAVVAACVLFDDWTSPAPARDLVTLLDGVACRAVIVDGYAWLGAERMGLGAHLHAAIGTPVIGVAKTRFASASAIEVLHGDSASPLFVTAAGCDPAEAAANVRAMDGAFRLPTLLRRVDHLARGLPL